MERARKRGLETHAVPAHPAATGGRGADCQTGELLVGLAAGDCQQVLPELFFRVGVQQDILRCVVHASQIARVLGIAASPLLWRRLQQKNAGARLPGHERSTQGSVAAADHKDIKHESWRTILPQRSGRRWCPCPVAID
jgi:hypothetical protein